MRRNLIRYLFLLVLVSLALSACSGGGATADEEATPTPLPTPQAAAKQTYTVTRGDILAQVQFSARIMPAVQDELFFRSSGRVRKVYVRAGDTVTKGQVLADLLSLDDMEAQARAQELNLRRAEINAEMAWLRQQLAATEMSTWDRGYAIRTKLYEYETELAQIAYEETKMSAQDLESAIQDAQIISSIDGRVLQMSVLEGQEVNAFSSLITVGDPTTLEVGATLTSTQMQDMAEGMPAVIELPSRPGEKLEGELRSMPYPYGSGSGKDTTKAAATGAAADTTSRVTLNDPNATENFRLGDLVQVTVIIESKQGVLWLPPSAIRNFEGRNFVVIQTDGLPRRQDVRIGIKNDEKVEILEGLEEGQIVIAP